VAVGAQHDLDARPVLPQGRDQAPQAFHDLSSIRSTPGAQDGGDHAAVTVEHHDRLKAVVVIVSVEQTKLLAAMHGVGRVVDIEHDAARYMADALAVVIHHRTTYAQKGTRIRRILDPRQGRLRA
jgi:hypothetical protein